MLKWALVSLKIPFSQNVYNFPSDEITQHLKFDLFIDKYAVLCNFSIWKEYSQISITYDLQAGWNCAEEVVSSREGGRIWQSPPTLLGANSLNSHLRGLSTPTASGTPHCSLARFQYERLYSASLPSSER